MTPQFPGVEILDFFFFFFATEQPCRDKLLSRLPVRARSRADPCRVLAVYAIVRSVTACLNCALSGHKGYVATWETLGLRIL